jgi:lipopolysaccharide/colanic/teichoic acid biosynthesis glycosyltransferase
VLFRSVFRLPRVRGGLKTLDLQDPMKVAVGSFPSLPADMLTAQGDLRITWVGRRLRHLNLDELTQLFKVLRSEMSLVGPRMLAPEVRRSGSSGHPEFQSS